MANARMAVSSVLGTVTNAANMVSNVVNVASDSVEMLHNYVNKHATMQSQRTLIELDNFSNRLIEETSRENVERKEEILKFLGNDEKRTALYSKEYERLHQLLNPTAETPSA